MNDDNIVKILKANAEKHVDDSRQIIKHKNNVMYGNQIGVVLSNINNDTFEVFIHLTINKEVISQVLYTTFNNITDATNLYSKYEKYIIDFDIRSILEEING